MHMAPNIESDYVQTDVKLPIFYVNMNAAALAALCHDYIVQLSGKVQCHE